MLRAPPPVSRQPYLVTIRYREPTYALVRGIEARLFSSSWTVEATSGDLACTLARSKFDEAFALSGVGWIREIESISVG